jgi:hypothetical protein
MARKRLLTSLFVLIIVVGVYWVALIPTGLAAVSIP